MAPAAPAAPPTDPAAPDAPDAPAAAEEDPWAGMQPLQNFVVMVYRCGACGMAFVREDNCVRHTRLPACVGAMVQAKACVVQPLDSPCTRRRQSRQRPGKTTVEHQTAEHIEHQTVEHIANQTTIIEHQTTIQNQTNLINIFVGNELGDLVTSGSLTESELIRRTVLENAEVRRQLRTIENIPVALFRVTNGSNGPRQLRNVKRDRRGVVEMSAAGERRVPLVEFCKNAAVKMVDELQAALRAVNDQSPVAVQEWARDVRESLNAKSFGEYDYPTVLKLYRDASSKFYRLPREHRDMISSGVRDIALFISEGLN